MTIIINGRKYDFFSKNISSNQLRDLAFNSHNYRISYIGKSKSGTMKPKDKVRVSEGMIFHVTNSTPVRTKKKKK